MATSSKVQFNLNVLREKALESLDFRIASAELNVASYDDDEALAQRIREWRARQEEKISDIFRQLGDGDLDDYRLSKVPAGLDPRDQPVRAAGRRAHPRAPPRKAVHGRRQERRPRGRRGRQHRPHEDPALRVLRPLGLHPPRSIQSITQENDMTDTPTHDSLNAVGNKPDFGTLSTVTRGGVPEALDHLIYANGELEDQLERLENRINTVLLSADPTPDPTQAILDRMPQSTVAEATHNEAARLERSISRLRAIVARVDL